jgi:hypothetical protein
MYLTYFDPCIMWIIFDCVYITFIAVKQYQMITVRFQSRAGNVKKFTLLRNRIIWLQTRNVLATPGIYYKERTFIVLYDVTRVGEIVSYASVVWIFACKVQLQMYSHFLKCCFFNIINTCKIIYHIQFLPWIQTLIMIVALLSLTCIIASDKN